MGKEKKRYNWKARRIVETDIDKSEQQKIKIDLQQQGNFDECNALVLPSKKRNSKIKKDPKISSQKILSKKQRKKLEKIVDRKKLKANRSAMIEALSKVQLPDEELKLMTSITEIQTKGLKRRWDSEKLMENQNEVAVDSEKIITIDAVKGTSKRQRILAAMISSNKKKYIQDPNIVGIESSSEELSSSSDEENKVDDSNIENPNEKNKTNIYEIDGKGTSEHENLEKSELKKNTAKESIKSQIIERGSYKMKKKIDNSFKPKETVKEVKKTTAHVLVVRDENIEEGRRKLPILGEEQVIMESISEHEVVILSGETGSGKTTQVPQFLYEAGYTSGGKMIGVTEPRRVAAVAMSKRVGLELGLGEDIVSYLVRFEGNTTPKTCIKFMTDGVLLKEIQSDFLLSRYSAIVVDEAHERSVSTDVVLGLLSRIVPLRCKKNLPLKLIIMSATLRVKDFTENEHLFPLPPPVIKVESRQYPVMVHFNKRTNPDYLKEAYRKICKIHSQLPDGGILVFLTGQQEVKSLVTKLRESFPKKKNLNTQNISEESVAAKEEMNLKEALKRAKKKSLPNINLDSYSCVPVDDAELDLLDDAASDDGWEDENNAVATTEPLWTLPLYSLLPSHKQAKVFQGTPPGCRLCVVSTNVAETSLTIPGVKYVVDCGKVKRKLEDKLTGVTGFMIQWASKAEANQRAGRAGRQAPGHCYRLYSSAVFNDEFLEWSEPEIKRRGVEDLVLTMKALGIQRVCGFPFPTPPDREQLEVAEKTLTLLEAIEKPPPNKDKWGGKLTLLGESMSALPVSPRYAKMLCLSQQQNLMDYCLALVAGLSVQELLLAPSSTSRVARRKAAGLGNSLLLGDMSLVLKAVGCENISESLGVREQAIKEARKLRNQLANQIALNCPHLLLSLDPNLKSPSDTQARLLRQIVLSGQVDRVAKLVEGEGQRKTLEYEARELEQRLLMHKDSVLIREKPQWIVYQEAYTVNNKMYMRGVTAIEPEWLVVFAPGLCNMSSPLEDPPPSYDAVEGVPRCYVRATFGSRGWELPVCQIEFPQGLDRYKWFAVFLLNGSVCPKLATYTKSLLSTPQTMIKSWAKLQPRTEIFLKTLVSKKIDSKEKLLECWKLDATYLMSAFQKWLPESASNEIASIWPPL